MKNIINIQLNLVKIKFEGLNLRFIESIETKIGLKLNKLESIYIVAKMVF